MTMVVYSSRVIVHSDFGAQFLATPGRAGDDFASDLSAERGPHFVAAGSET